MAKILLGVTGGISAYKAVDLVSAMKKSGHEVKVILTRAAQEFVTKRSLAVMSGNDVYDSEWTEGLEKEIPHIDLAQWCDVFVVAPCTANVIAKFAHGIADDLLTSTYMALTTKYKIIFPAMNTYMLTHPATERNLKMLKEDGVEIGETAVKELACGDVGKGGLLPTREMLKVIHLFAIASI